MRTVADPKTPPDPPDLLTETWSSDACDQELASPLPSDVYNLLEDVHDALVKLTMRLDMARDLALRKKPKRGRQTRKAGGL